MTGMERDGEAPPTLEAALGRIAELEGRLAVLGADGGSEEAGESGESGESEDASDTTRLAEISATSVAHLRRALLAENRGKVVPELVTGDTPEALEASVGVARAAWDRATEAARQALRADRVPAGAPARNGADAGAEGLSPLGKIARELKSE